MRGWMRLSLLVLATGAVVPVMAQPGGRPLPHGEWRQLPPEERRQMREQMRDHWQQQPREERDAWRERAREHWREREGDARRDWREAPGGSDGGRREAFRQLPPEERQRLREEMRYRQERW